jgi:hypothetical protein
LVPPPRSHWGLSDPLSAPADWGEAGSARPWACCCCRFHQPRRAVAVGRPQPSPLPSRSDRQCPSKPLGVEAHRIRHAQRDHFAALERHQTVLDRPRPSHASDQNKSVCPNDRNRHSPGHDADAGCSSDPAPVDRRPGIALKALAQIGDQLVVGYELPIIVGDLVRRERLKAFRRGHVDARRE